MIRIWSPNRIETD